MRIRSLCMVFALALSAVVVTAAPAAAAPHPCVQSGQCPESGWWQPPENTIVYDNPAQGYRVDWVQSYVVPPPDGGVPAWFTVIVEYWNYGNSIQYFTCQGVEDPSLAKEWFFRDGKEIGHVPATSTSCSERPDANFTLGPGRSFQLWATFHNVPWHGDGLSLEWSIVNRNALPHPRSAFVDPFPARPTDWGAFEPTTDPAAFGADLTECLAEKMHDPRGFGVGCAKIVVQGAGVALRFLHPRSAE